MFADHDAFGLFISDGYTGAIRRAANDRFEVAIPDRILVQLAETPDGVRYMSMAKGLVKPSGSYSRPSRRYAVALGCEIEHASEFVYGDALDLYDARSATPIGVSCRICPRDNCDQRAFPPAGRSIIVDPDERAIVPYAFR